MTRRVTRGPRRPSGTGRGALVQLAVFVAGLVVLLSFRDEIGQGTAGCYGNLAAGEAERGGASAGPDALGAPGPASASAGPPEAGAAPEAPDPAAVPVTVRRIKRPAAWAEGDAGPAEADAGPVDAGPR